MRTSIFLLFLSLICATAAENWPRFRGPMGAGVAPASVKLPENRSADSTKWSTELAGQGHSCPVIWGGKIFVTSAADKGAKRIIQCFDLHKGTELWQRDLDSSPHKRHKFNSFATSTPAVDAEHVYVLWGHPKKILLVAYDHAGKEKWRKDLGAYKSGHGFGVSPIVADGKVIVANDQEADNAIIALDAKTGDIAWKSKRKAARATYSTPTLYPHDNAGTDLILSDWQQGVTALDLATGKQRWSAVVFDINDKQRAIGSPIIWDELIIATCGFVTGNKRLVALRPAPGGNGKPKSVFQLDDFVAHVPTPLAHDGRLYLWSDSGIISCYELPSGEPTYERQRVPVSAKFFSSPIAVGDKIVNFSVNGDVVVLAAGDEFKILQKTELPEGTNATPAAADGRLVIRTKSHLLVY